MTIRWQSSIIHLQCQIDFSISLGGLDLLNPSPINPIKPTSVSLIFIQTQKGFTSTSLISKGTS